MIIWRVAVVSILGMLSAPVIGQESASQYPSRPIQIVVPYAAGGPNDLEVRLYASKLMQSLGQPVVSDFRPGAGGVIGNAFVAKAKPDGYTLLVVAGGFAVLPAFSKSLPYDTLADFAPVSLMSRRVQVFVVHPAFPAKTLNEYLSFAKLNPGKVNFGTSGLGASTHLAGVWLHSRSKTDVTYVQFKGTGPIVAELIAGRIDVAPLGLISVIGPIRARKLRPIAVLEDERTKLLTDVPTAKEQGVDGLSALVSLGISAPAGVPPAIITKLNQELVKITKMPDIIASLESGGNTVVGSSPGEYRAFLESQTARWKKLVQEYKIVISK